VNSSPAPRRLVLAALLIVALLAVACSGSGDSNGNTTTDDTGGTTDLTRATPSPIQTGGTLRYALNSETSSGWDPANSQWGGGGTTVARAIFDRIAELDADGRPQPNLAESLTPNDDFTQWIIVLRPDITFHNGEPLNAEAVRLNLDRARTSVLLGAVLGAYLGEVVVVDDLTLEVNTLKPWSTFPYSMSTQTGTVAAPEQLSSEAPAQRPIGTGPFVLEEWIPDNRLTVTRNENYWQTDAEGNQLPYLDGIEFTVIADQTSRGASLDSDAIDAMNTFEPQILERYLPLAENGTVQLISNANAEEQTQFVGLNTAQPPFDDPLARQIVATGLDTQLISDTQYFGLFPPSNSLFPTNSPYYAETSYPTYDLARATELHEEYQEKYGEPLSFSITLPSTPQFRSIGEAAQAQAAEFGAKIELNLTDESTLIVNALTGDYEATGFITFGEPPVDQIFISTDTLQPIGQLSLNFTRYADPEIQGAIDTIQSTDDEAEQIAQWAVIQERMAQNLNLVFVVRNRTAVIYANDVFGFAEARTPAGETLKQTASPFLGFVWMQQ
jgi:peptide/nickel transport system substrate-binding protein